MKNGGRRPGSGRKAGTANKKTREIADRAAAEGITPLELMLQIMRGQACPENADPAQKVAFHQLRFEAAKAAAPYIHPRLSNIDKPVQIGPLAGSLGDQGRAVLDAVSTGKITPSQASTLMTAIGSQARIVEVSELAERVTALEKQANEKH
jgi:hypothetical protein